MFDLDRYLAEIKLPRWRVARVGCRTSQLFAAQFTLGVSTRAAILQRVHKFRRRWAFCLRSLACRRLWSFYPNEPEEVTPWSFDLPRFGLTYRRCFCCRPSFLFFYPGAGLSSGKKINHQIRPCRRPVCPFCFARRSQRLFIYVKRIVNRWRKMPVEPVALTYRVRREFVPALGFSPVAGCDRKEVQQMAQQLRKVVARHRAARRKIERSKNLQRKTLGTLWRVVVYPTPTADGWCVETRELIAATRSFRVDSSCLVQLGKCTTGETKRWLVGETPGHAGDDEFYQFFGAFCRYPETLLATYVELTAAVLWATAELCTISATGVFRSVLSRPAASTSPAKNFAVKRSS
ncbi:hypothetical protein EBU99_06725 [bacterium]|nr:hypothetical protein [bacterium]